jgi:hypothetical protein
MAHEFQNQRREFLIRKHAADFYVPLEIAGG